MHGLLNIYPSAYVLYVQVNKEVKTGWPDIKASLYHIVMV